MGSFTLLKRIMRFSGILFDPNHSKTLMLISNCYFFVVFICYFLSTFWFFCFQAKVLAEYTGCFYFNCCSSLIFTWYWSYVSHRKDYADLFNALDAMIEKSKFKTMESFLGIFMNEPKTFGFEFFVRKSLNHVFDCNFDGTLKQEAKIHW